MSLAFPNPGRSYNPDRQSITFWASDRTLEVTFEIDHSALAMIDCNSKTEDEYLSTFDYHRPLIEAAAIRTYKAHPDFFYILNKDSF